MKKSIVQKLSMMQGKVVTDYMLETAQQVGEAMMIVTHSILAGISRNRCLLAGAAGAQPPAS